MANHRAIASLLGVLALGVCGDVNNDVNGQQTLEQTEHLQSFDELKERLSDMERLAGKMTSTKKEKCIKAIGHQRFCNCLKEKSPIGVTFEQYIVATASTKEELGYSKLGQEDRLLIDGSRKARDQCVTEVFQKE